MKRRQRKSLIALGATVPPMPPFWERWLQRGFSFCGGNDEENDRFTIRLYDQNSDVVEDRSSFNKVRTVANCVTFPEPTILLQKFSMWFVGPS